MKKILAILCIIPSIAYAFTNSEKQSLQMSTYQTVCLNAKDFTNLVGEFKEVPFARGISKPVIGEGVLSLVIFVNPETKTFTMAEKAAEDLYCVLAVGAEFEPVPQDIRDNVINEYKKGIL